MAKPLTAPAVKYATTMAMIIADAAPSPELLYLKESCTSFTCRQSTSPRCSAALIQANCGSAATSASMVWLTVCWSTCLRSMHLSEVDQATQWILPPCRWPAGDKPGSFCARMRASCLLAKATRMAR